MKRIALYLICFAGFFYYAYPEDKPIITVLDFTLDSVAESEMKSIISLLSSALFRTDKYIVIDVTERDTILKELQFSISDCTDESCQLQIGRMLSAECIVTGRIGKLGTRYMLAAKILETETGRTVSTSDGLYKDMDELVENLQNFVHILADPETRPTIEPAAETAEGPEEEITKTDEPKKTFNYKLFIAAPLLTAGLGAGGYGGYLIYAAFQYQNETVEPAWAAYDEAAAGSDFDSLYSAYEQVFNNHNQKLITSIIITGTGAVLSTAAAVLFLLPEEKPNTNIAFYTGMTADDFIMFSIKINY